MITNLLTPTHVAILLVILLLLFGAKRLPETGRALGRGMREFKDAITGNGEDLQPDTTIQPHTSTRTPTPARARGERT